MKKINSEIIYKYFENFQSLDADQLTQKVETYLDDDAIEAFVEHIEDFYGIEDDEDLGTLAQIMVSGFIAALEIKTDLDSKEVQ